MTVYGMIACVCHSVLKGVTPEVKGDVDGSSRSAICQKLSHVLNARRDNVPGGVRGYFYFPATARHNKIKTITVKCDCCEKRKTNLTDLLRDSAHVS